MITRRTGRQRLGDTWRADRGGTFGHGMVRGGCTEQWARQQMQTEEQKERVQRETEMKAERTKVVVSLLCTVWLLRSDSLNQILRDLFLINPSLFHQKNRERRQPLKVASANCLFCLSESPRLLYKNRNPLIPSANIWHFFTGHASCVELRVAESVAPKCLNNCSMD